MSLHLIIEGWKLIPFLLGLHLQVLCFLLFVDGMYYSFTQCFFMGNSGTQPKISTWDSAQRPNSVSPTQAWDHPAPMQMVPTRPPTRTPTGTPCIPTGRNHHSPPPVTPRWEQHRYNPPFCWGEGFWCVFLFNFSSTFPNKNQSLTLTNKIIHRNDSLRTWPCLGSWDDDIH